MSKYTTEVRFICESESGLDESSAYRGVDTVITSAMPKIFSFTYPIFDESYRNVLQKKILKHFYTREIGLETYGLWKLKLDTRLNEIMPYYNRLYESELLEYNPLYTVDLTRVKKNTSNYSSTSNNVSESNSTVSNNKETSATNTANTSNVDNANGTSTTDTNSTSSILSNGSKSNENTNLYSDTPQGQISHLEDKTYLTNATQINDNTINHDESNESDTSHETTTNNTSANSNTNTIETTNASTNDNTSKNDNIVNNSINASETLDDYIERVSGYENKNVADLILKFRKTFLNIDMMIINDLEDLFLQLC